MILLPLFPCLQWQHLQRSYFTHRDQASWYGTCLQGKRRVQNTYPPYDWCVASLDALVFGQQDLWIPVTGQAGWKSYNEAVARLPPGKRPFLVPGHCRDKTFAWSEGHAVSQGMSYRAWTEMFRGILVQLGEGAAAGQYTFHSVRKFMPMLAGFVHLDEQQAQSLG